MDGFGAIFGGNGKPDIDFVDCGSCAYAHPNTGVCAQGICGTGTVTPPPSGGNDDPKECTQNADCPSGKICTEKSICESVSGDCARSSQCSSGEYCAIEATVKWKAQTDSLEYSDYVGTCKPIGEAVTGSLTGWISSNFASTTVSCTEEGDENTEMTIKCTGNPMTWWSAQNWCEAKGKTLVKAEDFNCSNGVQGECDCLKTGTECHPSYPSFEALVSNVISDTGRNYVLDFIDKVTSGTQADADGSATWVLFWVDNLGGYDADLGSMTVFSGAGSNVNSYEFGLHQRLGFSVVHPDIFNEETYTTLGYQTLCKYPD